MRSCLVRFEGENIRDSILVQQGEVADILGTYYFNYHEWYTLSTKNAAINTIISRPVKVRIVEEKAGQVCILFPETNQYLPGIRVPLTWEEGELRFYIHGGQKVGEVNPGGGKTFYSLFTGVEVNHLSGGYHGSFASLAFQFYNEGDDIVAWSFDNNSAGEYVPTGLLFVNAPLDATTVNDENYLGFYGCMNDIYLTKIKD
jgi:hypothetical protein